MDPTLILTAFIPIITDAVKSVIAKFSGNTPKIVNADDYSKVVDADIKKLEALAKLDTPEGATSLWVNNLKSLQRIIVVYTTIGTWTVATFVIDMSPDKYKLISDLCTSIFFFLFGDRVNFYIRKSEK